MKIRYPTTKSNKTRKTEDLNNHSRDLGIRELGGLRKELTIVLKEAYMPW